MRKPIIEHQIGVLIQFQFFPHFLPTGKRNLYLSIILIYQLLNLTATTNK